MIPYCIFSYIVMVVFIFNIKGKTTTSFVFYGLLLILLSPLTFPILILVKLSENLAEE